MVTMYAIHSAWSMQFSGLKAHLITKKRNIVETNELKLTFQLTKTAFGTIIRCGP